MNNHSNTYLADVCSNQGPEEKLLANLGPQVGLPSSDHFLDIDLARSFSQQIGSKIYAITSLGSWFLGGQYLGLDGNFGSIGENDPKEFFEQTNLARLSLLEEVPDNEFWYAKIGGDFPDKLVFYLHKYADCFDGVKIGAFRPKDFQFADSKYQSLWELCVKKKWPVLAHCSEKNEQNFYDLWQIAHNFPTLKICASHLAGENKEFIKERADFLKDKVIPANFFFNIVVRDLSLVRILLEKNSAIMNHLLFGTDIPFLGEYESFINRLKTVFNKEEIKRIMQNSEEFLLEKFEK